MYAGHSTGDMGIVEREDAGARLSRPSQSWATPGCLPSTAKSSRSCGLRTGTRPAGKPRAGPAAGRGGGLGGRSEGACAGGRLCGDAPRVPHLDSVGAGRAAGEAPAAGAGPAGCGRRRRSALRVTCGLTPHHALLDAGMMESADGLLLLTNPPLRPPPMPSLMLERLCDGSIDWIETDHAPHTREDKMKRFACGLPGASLLPAVCRGAGQGRRSRKPHRRNHARRNLQDFRGENREPAQTGEPSWQESTSSTRSRHSHALHRGAPARRCTSAGSIRRPLNSTGHLTTRAPLPVARASTCSSLAIVISPGYVVRRAPCAHPSLSASAGALSVSNP